MSDRDTQSIPDGCDLCPNRVKSEQVGKGVSLLFALFLCGMAAAISFDRKEGWFRPDPPPIVWGLISLSTCCIGIRISPESLASIVGINASK